MISGKALLLGGTTKTAADRFAGMVHKFGKVVVAQAAR